MAPAIARRQQRPPHLTRRHALASLLRSDGSVDWSPWYLTEEDDMGQSGEHGQIIDVLLSSLRELAREREWSSVLVAADNFFAWIEEEPHVQVSPDIYLLDDPPASDEPLPTRWEVWRAEHGPPRFAIEIVSDEWKKDYEINPARYDHLGVQELVLADRDAFVRESSGVASGVRTPFVVYRRTEEDRLERVHHGPGPVYCGELDAWLSFRWDSPGRPRVRVSHDENGEQIIPTAEEKATAETLRADAAARKAAAETRRADAAARKARTETLRADAAEKLVRDQADELEALRARLRELE